MRRELSRPFGRIMSTKKLSKSVKKDVAIYAVGDVTVSELLKHRYTPKVAVFDYRTGKGRAYFPIIKRMYKNPWRVKNQRGALSRGLWDLICKAQRSKSPVGILVSGEEDLASLACIYFAKNGELVIYGLRGKGMAVIKIDKTIKDHVIKVLHRMSKD